MEKPKVRTRIAPSPTGKLHVGTARAALFNELFAKQNDGQFVLRIEDTDRERSKAEHEQDILEGLRWLGLTWDEGPDEGGVVGPYRQSEREEHYRAGIKKLLESDKAYLEKDSGVIKFRVMEESVTFTDLIRGEVTVSSDSWGGDFIVARSLDDPLYHLAVVIDDAAMQISHVIRGEDHLTNTARHILLQQALGVRQPEYAHLPLLLDEKRRKLSKRAGEVSLMSYRDAGYLPEALLNYLALLGWNPDTDEELFSHQELVERFNLANVQKGGAIFSLTKLDSINKKYLRKLSAAELLETAKPWLEKAGIAVEDKDYWQRALVTEQERVATLAELVSTVDFYKPDWAADYEPAGLIWRQSDKAATLDLLDQLRAKLSDMSEDDFTKESLSKLLLAWIDQAKLGRGDVLWPMRYALTGRDKSPSQFEIAAVLGKKKTLERIDKARGLLSQP